MSYVFKRLCIQLVPRCKKVRSYILTLPQQTARGAHARAWHTQAVARRRVRAHSRGRAAKVSELQRRARVTYRQPDSMQRHPEPARRARIWHKATGIAGARAASECLERAPDEPFARALRGAHS